MNSLIPYSEPIFESLKEATQNNPISYMNYVWLIRNIEHLKAYGTMNRVILEGNPVSLN